MLHAGAWTDKPGHGQVIVTGSYYRTSTEFDSQRNVQSFGYGGDFRQVILNTSTEVGLTRHDTLFVNAPGEWLRFANQYGKTDGVSAGDIEVGWRRLLNRENSPWALSGQMLVMFPAYSATQNPAPGNHQEDVEGRILLGRGTEFGHQHLFWDLEGGYRYRSGAPADQVRSDGTIGFEIAHRVMLMGQVFGITGMRNGQAENATSNPNAQSDFDLYKVQPSVVLSLTHNTRLQCGWNDAFAGRNTGNGQSVILAVWRTF